MIDPPSAGVLVHLRDERSGVGGNGKEFKEIPSLGARGSAPRKSREVAAAAMGRATAHQYPVLPGFRPLLDRPVARRVRAVDAARDIDRPQNHIDHSQSPGVMPGVFVALRPPVPVKANW